MLRLSQNTPRSHWQGDLARQDHYVIAAGGLGGSLVDGRNLIFAACVLHVCLNEGPLVNASTRSLKCPGARVFKFVAMQLQSRQIPAEPYAFPHDNSLSPATTALVVIDMQRDCESSLESLS